MTEIQVLGITTRRSIEFERSFCIMGFGDIALPGPEVTLRGCALARSNGRIIALPPKIPGAKLGELSAMQWNASGEFAQRVKEKLLEAYRKMGGEMPPEPERRRDHVTGKPIGADPFDTTKQQAVIAAAKAGEIEYRTFPATFTVTGPESEAVADDTEATEGLHRVLGLDAVEETLERAGL